MACNACKKGLPCQGKTHCPAVRRPYSGSPTAGDIDVLIELEGYDRVKSVAFVAVDSSGNPEAVAVEVSLVDRVASTTALAASLPNKRKLYEDRVAPQTDAFYLLGPDGKGYEIPMDPTQDKPVNLYVFVDASAMSAGGRAYVMVELV